MDFPFRYCVGRSFAFDFIHEWLLICHFVCWYKLHLPLYWLEIITFGFGLPVFVPCLCFFFLFPWEKESILPICQYLWRLTEFGFVFLVFESVMSFEILMSLHPLCCLNAQSLWLNFFLPQRFPNYWMVYIFCSLKV